MSISVELINISKKFNLYHDRTPTLKERVIFWNRQKTEEYWALKNVNLKISKGKTVGLIGRNGSGKSTLLKIISKILYPSSGELIINGRISTLLELGAGFHPDFTGRENIFLNSSILGLSRKQTEKRLNEIIQFAELEEFIDNPVRNYSSGMYMRLGFSVAVHVEPDILLVDEVLAVGDLSFQKKCLEKINEFRAKGKTIIFVTHDMSLVQRICDEVVWLENGVIIANEKSREVVNSYLDLVATREEQRMMREHQQSESKEKVQTEEFQTESKEPIDTLTEMKQNRWGNGKIEITDVRLFNEEGIENYSYECGESVSIVMHYTMHQDVNDQVFGIGIFREQTRTLITMK
jgi:ABC-type polysaccharide/polyol phosphate transport system ATPase subunit